MRAFRNVGAVLLALVACARGEKSKGETKPSPARSTSERERVVATLQLELGEGDDRSLRVTLWPADESPEVELPAGTRIEKLEQPADREPPARGLWRVRVTSGERAGLVGYVRSYQTQAAR